MRVGPPQPYGAAATPVLERERLVERLVVAVERDLEGTGQPSASTTGTTSEQ